MHLILYWSIFAATCLFAFAYKAVMATGSEDHVFQKVKTYFVTRPMTVIMRFLLAQMLYFFVFANPKVLGGFLFGDASARVTFGPCLLASALGLSGDKSGDVVIVFATFVFNKVTGFLKNGNGSSQ